MEEFLPQTLEQVFNFILAAIAVFLFLCGAIYAIGKARDTIKGWKKPKDDLRELVEDHTDRLERGNERFNRQDAMIGQLQEGQRVTCEGVQALLTSAVYGDNESGLKKALDSLNTYLVAHK